ncbi:hypothetical protein ACN38_g2611 [Penicillium nordicum]|uniref:Uncharacterized protein n=1 Tax=Penicillium nordicum TaxID=229535 RepID=A0A0M9WIQ0_9EURO|nr:hypothetical protein ACN38_g2611 [Penicillium nordicum]
MLLRRVPLQWLDGYFVALNTEGFDLDGVTNADTDLLAYAGYGFHSVPNGRRGQFALARSLGSCCWTHWTKYSGFKPAKYTVRCVRRNHGLASPLSPAWICVGRLAY